jgi:hypothetical protein
MVDATATQREIAGKGGKSCREKLKRWIEDGQLAYSIFVPRQGHGEPKYSTQKVGNKKILLACQLYQSRLELLLIKYHVGSKQDHQGEEDKIP